ncbi:MAG: MFS transporter [Caulobacteraceae bacterium]
MEVKNLQIAILVVGMGFLTLGFSILMPILPYYSKNLGASAFDLGMLMASYSIMQLIFTPFWGELSDRIGRKPIFLIGLFGYGISFIIYGISTQLWMLFAARMTGGLLAGGIYPASLAYIADVTDPQERGRVMGLLGAASGVGMIFGPVVSGVFSVWGLAAPFFITAAVSFIFGILGHILLKESRAVNVHRIARRKKVSLIAPLRTPLGILFIVSLLISFLISSFQSTFAYYILGRFGLTEAPGIMPVLDRSMALTGPGVMAMLFTVMGIAGVLCQGFLVGESIDIFGEERTVIYGLAISSAGFLMVLLSGELVMLMFSACMIGVGTGLVTPCLNSIVSRETGEEYQGVALGVLGSYSAVGRVVGPPSSGLIYDINVDLPYVVSTLLSVAGALVMWSLAKTSKR